jgi:excisionase family DNA binding protein
MSERATFPEAVLTTQEVAQLLQISRRSVQWLIKQRRLKAIRIGRAYRVRASALHTFFAQHETGASEPPTS